ncbi:MAG: hypothetical protein OXU88_09325 [Gammaproteobacteria bacterium]|nr:hypothetical protein [Gammaproteobacteria bacterium]
MVAPEYHRAYRRGIVLGLSLAELFILLVFLLLLALLGYALLRDDQAARQAQIIAKQQGQLDDYAPFEDVDPNDLVLEGDLLAAKNRARQAEQEAEQQAQKIAELQQRIEKLVSEKERAEARAREFEQRAKLAEARVKELEIELKESKRGQFSPCWYVIVQEKGEERESAVFTFDVRMKNETVLVQVHYRLPPPGAYTPAVEYDHAALGRELTYSEFMREFEPLKIAGREKRVRDRECYFHVQVWDATSDKTAYKIAFDDYVREVFVPTSVRRDPWPH